MTQPEPLAVEIDAQLVASYEYACEEVARWTKLAKGFADELRKQAGSGEEIAVNGEIRYHYRPIDAFQGKRFAKENPEDAAFFTRTVPVERLDVDEIRRLRPELFSKYQSRALTKAA